MLHILVPYIVFLFLGFVLEFFGMTYSVSYAIKTVITLGLIVYFWKKYNFRFKWSWFAVVAGVTTFLLWVGLDGWYPLIGESSSYHPESGLLLVFRFAGAILVAPLVEEVLTRGWLIRFLIDNNWEKVKHGTFTWSSFLITVAFFGFSHSRWLAGIVTGVIFNLVWYKEKSLEPCIIAHLVANLLLAVYVVSTGSWQFW